jgi:carbon-monoxide dehydrogenase large subunit
MNEAVFRAVGRPLPRKEDARLVTGRGRFSDDFSLPGQAYAVMLRSPHPHARIVDVNVAGARAMPGVLGVFTGADCRAEGLSPIPHDPVPKTKYDMKLAGPGGSAIFIGPHLLLPTDKVRHVGEAVAMVVAATLAQGLDAAEAVEVTYDQLPFVTHAQDAMRAGAPAVWGEVPDNVLVDTMFGDAEATKRAFAAAAHVVAKDFHVGRVTGVPLEPRSALGHYDYEAGFYMLYAV